eukprot:754004_1
MHYHRTAFAIDTNIATITPIQSLNGVIMGQRNGLSDTDKACVNVLYQRCCKDGICVEKQKDWANVYYCPDECKAGIYVIYTVMNNVQVQWVVVMVNVDINKEIGQEFIIVQIYAKQE